MPPATARPADRKSGRTGHGLPWEPTLTSTVPIPRRAGLNSALGNPQVVPDAHRRLAAIMFTDIVGFAAMTQADEAATLRALERHNALLRPIFARFGGREVKTVGDAFLVEFASALDAARCALEIQDVLHDPGAAGLGSPPIRVRIGIHVGDVVPAEGDVLGDAVNIASRVAPLAEPGGICFTQQVFDQVQNKISTPTAKLPPVLLKNIRLPTTVYRFVPGWEMRGEEVASRGPTSGRGLAVLPLANISPDPKDEYFADGLTEELISVLSQVRGLSVIARTSVVPYKSAPRSVAQVGSELGVDSVLEGSVRKAGTRMRITLQLVDVATQRHVWAGSYDREVGDVFAVQTDVAERTAEALRLELARAAGPADERRTTTDPVAYDLYLRGLVAASESSGSGSREAFRCFERAVERDPGFADAYAAWANHLVVLAGDHLPMQEVMPRARELAARALELDPDSSEAHASLANIAMQFDNDWPRAEAEFERAIAINPSNVTAYRFYGALLVATERFDEAKEIFRRAIRLDPGGPDQRSLSWAELESGRFDAAIAQAEEARDRHPNALRTHIALGLFYLCAGRRDDAEREAESTLPPADDVERFDHALLRALVGKPEPARTIIAEVERGEAKSYTSPTHLAMLYSALGNTNRALDLLEQDAHGGDRVLWLFYRGIFFDPLRDDPRFVRLLRESRLPVHPIRRPGPPARRSPGALSRP